MPEKATMPKFPVKELDKDLVFKSRYPSFGFFYMGQEYKFNNHRRVVYKNQPYMANFLMERYNDDRVCLEGFEPDVFEEVEYDIDVDNIDKLDRNKLVSFVSKYTSRVKNVSMRELKNAALTLANYTERERLTFGKG